MKNGVRVMPKKRLQMTPKNDDDRPRRLTRKLVHDSCSIKNKETARAPLNSRTLTAADVDNEYTNRVIFNVPKMGHCTTNGT